MMSCIETQEYCLKLCTMGANELRSTYKRLLLSKSCCDAKKANLAKNVLSFKLTQWYMGLSDDDLNELELSQCDDS